MKYNEAGFRALYHNFCAFKLQDKYKEMMQDFPGIADANCMLVYGYIDADEGLMLDVLAVGKEEQGSYKFFETLENDRLITAIRELEETEFVFFDDSNGNMHQRYAAKLQAIAAYDASEEVEETRRMGFLDDSRNPYHPDEVQVYLVREGMNREVCTVRITGLSDHGILGTLLFQPQQDFGCRRGEEVAFFVQELQDKRVVCYADMTPTVQYKPEDLADGSLLKRAIAAFHENRNKANFLEVMSLLRDSKVWIPYNEQQGVSDILKKGEEYFFPAFSNEAEMGQYGVHFSKVQKSFTEVIDLAGKNEKQVTGIVLNPFTQSFLLERDLFEMVGELKSRLING